MTEPPRDGDTASTHRLVAERAGDRTLLLVIGRGAVESHVLPATGAIVLGRSRAADVVIDDRSVSRRHARLVLEPERISVADLGSANGTRIGHLSVDRDPVPVEPGEPFHLGAVTVVVASPIASAVGRPGVAAADPMAAVGELAARFAAGQVSILIQGETGVGKERLAEQIHSMSPRAAGPYVRINCAAIAEQLVESELFGHERGAFTGAHASKPGLLEAASGGTAFLDEVGELLPAMQAKLLRALEERSVRRIGAVAAQAIDVRFVSASNRDLEEEVEQGRFRRDLYYRLAGATLYVPPLRDRRGEIASLAARFIAEAAAAQGDGPPRLAGEATEWLVSHDWPGNVRELRSSCERAVLLAEGGVLRREHFQVGGGRRGAAAASGPAPEAGMLEATRREVESSERQRIVEALERAQGNQTRAAELLGISRRTLVQRLTAYDLRPRRKR